MPEFLEQDQEAIVAFIRKHPLGMLAAVGETGAIEATHVPLLLTQNGTDIMLRGHVMRKTAHWGALKTARDVFIAFTGPDAPILASWNDNLVFGGTWNYMAVHVRGTLSFVPESDLLQILKELKDTYEVVPEAKFDLLPKEYLDRLVGAIEAFEIKVTSTQAVFKLSQNRSVTDFDSTVKALTERGGESALVAEEMSVRKDGFFASALP